MIEKIAIYPNPYRDPDGQFCNTIKNRLDAKGVATTIIDEKTTIPNDSDMIIALGGDGTILRCATREDAIAMPILGVNIGHLGFMSGIGGIAQADLEALDKIIDGEFDISERMMLDVRCNGEHKLALNELKITPKEPTGIKVAMYIDSDYVKTFFGDGVILATPTGSTGWFNSYAHTPVDPEADVFAFTPVGSIDVGLNTFMTNSERRVRFEVVSDGGNPALLDIDGCKEHRQLLHDGDNIFVSCSPVRTLLVLPKNHENFFRRIRSSISDHQDKNYDYSPTKGVKVRVNLKKGVQPRR
ncbi:MAG: NAD(+)/NADH kinase [Clostridiales bacterium]|jgi:NAD+ kinase|nr:NAD(+)/NADH kinase [Clostridiales bacterium]